MARIITLPDQNLQHRTKKNNKIGVQQIKHIYLKE
jgi:hypothetical protein